MKAKFINNSPERLLPVARHRAGDRVDVKVIWPRVPRSAVSYPPSPYAPAKLVLTPTAVCCNRQCHAGCAQWRAGGKFPACQKKCRSRSVELRLADRNQVYSSSFRVGKSGYQATFPRLVSFAKKSSKLAKAGGNCNRSTRMASRW